MNTWVTPDVRDCIVDYIRHWSTRSEIPLSQFIGWLGISASKFYHWKGRYGKVNEHNRWIPRDHWLEQWEKDAIVDFYLDHPNEGYRRLAFMMLDQNLVAVSPSTFYRVLKQNGYLKKWCQTPSAKGTGFQGPILPHEHWHIDISYLNISGTFYYLCSILDGYSRYLVHWEIRERMREEDVAIIVQRAKEKFPQARPRLISDHGPQFIAKDFKEFIRISGMSHVLIRPYYPQSNGKKERWFRTLKSECIRPRTPISLDDAKRLVSKFVNYYNSQRLHSAIGYIAPEDKLHGREKQIFIDRDRKLHQARQQRKANREKMKTQCQSTNHCSL